MVSKQSQAIKRGRQATAKAKTRSKDVIRYLEQVKVSIKDNIPQTRKELIARLKQADPGQSRKAIPFIRHEYTNYDEVCDYVLKRWHILIPIDIKQEVLHPRYKAVIRRYLQSIDALDLIQSGQFAIKNYNNLYRH